MSAYAVMQVHKHDFVRAVAFLRVCALKGRSGGGAGGGGGGVSGGDDDDDSRNIRGANH